MADDPKKPTFAERAQKHGEKHMREFEIMIGAQEAAEDVVKEALKQYDADMPKRRARTDRWIKEAKEGVQHAGQAVVEGVKDWWDDRVKGYKEAQKEYDEAAEARGKVIKNAREAVGHWIAGDEHSDAHEIGKNLKGQGASGATPVERSSAPPARPKPASAGVKDLNDL